MESIKQQWQEFAAVWVAWWDGFRLDLAVLLANVKHKASATGEAYYVLPDQKEKLLVLSPGDIERLKAIGEIRFRAVTKQKQVHRYRKDGSKRLVKKKVRVIGRKAYGIRMMSHEVTIADVDRECFYRTGLSRKDSERKHREWALYIAEMRRRAKQKKA
jgi:hypothetical protein